jgi:phospholipid/cholesterol/gamma-HCH transport system permease protein
MFGDGACLWEMCAAVHGKEAYCEGMAGAMAKDSSHALCRARWSQAAGHELLVIKGPLTIATVAMVWPVMRQHRPRTTNVVFDCAGITDLDSAGIAALATCARDLHRRGCAIQLQNVAAQHDSLIKIFDWETLQNISIAHVRPQVYADLMTTVKAAAIRARDVVVFAGRTTIGFWYVLCHPCLVSWRSVVHNLLLAGPGAVPVVCLISFLVGFVVAFQAAQQLERFGAQFMVAHMVGFALFRELAPIMTAVIMAGRTGSAFAAEIGSMKLSEELDAMEIMVLDPYRYVIAPTLIAALIAFPCLTMLADIAGLLGGTFTSAVFLNMPVRIFLNQAFEHIKPSDLGMGLYKSLIFACLVGGVGCLCGMHVRYGATSVGRATTAGKYRA